MRKIIITVLLAGLTAGTLSGCAQGSINVTVEKPVEEAKPAEEEPVSGSSWIEEYSEAVSKWHDLHKDESCEGYSLIYLNDDDIPELCMSCEYNEYYSATDMYTVSDEKLCHLDVYDLDHKIVEDEYTIPGGQGHGMAYLERGGYLTFWYSGGGIDRYSGYLMNTDRLDQVMTCISDHTGLEGGNPYYEEGIKYYKKDGTLYESEDPDLSTFRTEYGFNKDDRKDMDSFGYEEFIGVLKGFNSGEKDGV